MILIDTSVWIDHFWQTNAKVVRAIVEDAVSAHPLVIEELAAGSIKDRREVLASLGDYRPAPMLQHFELMRFIEQKRLWGRGLGVVDLHLLGSCLLQPGLALMTNDKRLAAAAIELSIPTE